MSPPTSLHELDCTLVSSMEENRIAFGEETPFRMLIIGDFSGRANREFKKTTKPLMGTKPIRVDRDTLDKVLDRLSVKIELPLLAGNRLPVSLSFSELDDFHPDALYQNIEIFRALKEKRKSLDDPAACLAFAEELRSPNIPDKKIEIPRTTINQSSASLLDQIIEQGQPETSSSSLGFQSTDFDCFLQSIVKPYLMAKNNPRQEEMIDAVDAAATELMNMILHHGDYQALESAWRGLSFLVSRLETNSQLELFLFDVSKKELAADLTETNDLNSTSFHKILVEQAVGIPGGQPWGVVAGNYVFDKCIEDMEILGRIAKIVSVAGCSFISAAGDSLLTKNTMAETPDPDDWCPLDDPRLEECWQVLRRLPEAVNLGLVLPRFLLRLPYGADTDPIDTFYFEEMDSLAVHEHYLWGNPCFAIMLLLGQSFGKKGGEVLIGSVLEVNSLPLHVHKVDGESHLKPCAEILLSQRAAEQIINLGIMPLLSLYNQDKVRLGRFQSIAEPFSQLSGPWS